jgi:methionine aminopeptidase
MIALKSPREIELMAEGGRILGATVSHLRAQAKAGVSTWVLD